MGQTWHLTYSLHCNSFLGLLYRILNIYLVKPKKELQWRLQGTYGRMDRAVMLVHLMKIMQLGDLVVIVPVVSSL